MRTCIISLVALGALIAGPGDEPSERQMRLAFQDRLALQVRNALEFADETGGADAVALIHNNGTDHFAIDAFQKLKCLPESGSPAYRCDFWVGIGLVNGTLERTLSGRFLGGPKGLVFVHDL
jgi:hypothetical protein